MQTGALRQLDIKVKQCMYKRVPGYKIKHLCENLTVGLVWYSRLEGKFRIMKHSNACFYCTHVFITVEVRVEHEPVSILFKGITMVIKRFASSLLSCVTMRTFFLFKAHY